MESQSALPVIGGRQNEYMVGEPADTPLRFGALNVMADEGGGEGTEGASILLAAEVKLPETPRSSV